MTRIEGKPIRSNWAKTREHVPVPFILVMAATLTIGVAFLGLLLYFVVAGLLSERLELGAMIADSWGFLIMVFIAGLGWAAVAWASSEAKFRRLIRGKLCTNCKYDLRGTIEAGGANCPECGAMIEQLDAE